MAEGATARARAPGKVILLGEHFVVYGVPAVASAIDRGIEVTAARTPGSGIEVRAEGADTERSAAMVATILDALGVSMSSFPRRRESSACADRGVALQVSSDIPVGAGLGASAAFSVSSTRALAKLFGLDLSDDALFRTALAAEAHAHRTPSGIDPYASIHGGVVLFESGPPIRAEVLKPPGPLDLVIAVTPEKRDTGAMVEGAAAFAERDAEGFRALLDSARKLSAAGGKAIEAGDLKELGGIMNDNHGLLQALGVSTPGLDALVEAARDTGAAGAKLTGAGGGGAMIALCPGVQDEVADACSRAGAAEVFKAKIG